MSYGICDDFGIWVVSNADGPYLLLDDAQDECNRRNFEEGTAAIDGELKDTMTRADIVRYRDVHFNRPDCTCKVTKASYA